MKKYDYSVVLDTELGKRNGTMQLSVNGTSIDGFLSLLNNTESCHGIIQNDGRCLLQGKIVTLIKEIVYDATGYIRENEIALILKIEKNTFRLKGVALPKMSEY